MLTRLSTRRLAGIITLVAALTGMAVPAAAAATATGGTRPAAGPARARPAAAAPAGAEPYQDACAPKPRTGYATCFALVRTDAAAHAGRLAAGATPPGYGPADLQSAYALPSASAGSGATVAIVDAYDDPYAESDLAVYRQQYGLPACTTANGCFRKINQHGGSQPPARDPGWSDEISLDLDMVSAACPRCHILLVEANSPSFADLGAAVNEAAAQGARYISNSYGSAGEASSELQLDSRYYNHPGVVVTAAAGDDGFGAAFPAASPHVVAVGGTTLTRAPAQPRGWAETSWAGTGSGCSGYEPKPAWQTDDCTTRAENDVSAVANPDTGVAVYDTYDLQGWNIFGGTSAATPLIASAYALAGPPVGGTYPGSYPYADPSALNDITSGPGNLPGGCAPWTWECTPGPGYDGPTGLGTPNGVSAFAAGPHGEVTGTVINTVTGAPVAGVQVSIGAAIAVTGPAGQYQTTAPAGSYPATATDFGYATRTIPDVTVTGGGTTRQDFALRPRPEGTVSGTVRDASGHGWPLYARIAVAGTQTVTYTNPVTGAYHLTLPVTGSAYTLDVSAVYPGYQPAKATVSPTPAGASQDVGLTVDAATCDAPGYRPTYQGATQTFSGTTAPPGWTVPKPKTGPAWQFGDPGGLPNYTGGSGNFALIDGLATPHGGVYAEPAIISPPIDLAQGTDPVPQFDQDLSESIAFPGDQVIAGVEVSLDGGHSWSVVNDYYGPMYLPGPDTAIFPLPQAAGHSDVRVQFWTSGFAGVASWELDDVFVGDRGCAPTPGGLVVGQVTDHNTAAPVNGANVTSSAGPGQTATTEPEPGDPAVGGGLYWLPARAGQQTLSASAGGYASGSARLTVASNAVTSANFSLAAGRLAVTPGTISVTAPMGGPAAMTRLTVTNTGGAPVTVSPTAVAGSFTTAGPQQPGAGGAPLQTITGHFSTRPLASAARTRRARRPDQTGPPSYVPPWVPVSHYPEAIVDNAAATDPATGLVYSAGGVNDTGNATADAFVYSPVGRAWRQLPSLSYPVDAPTAAVIAGKLYVTGGYDDADQVNQRALEIYDPATNLWSAGAPIPHAYYGAAAAVLDGKMYVIGGCSADGECTSTDVQVYDPATNTWTAAAAYPRKISFLGCGAISGTLYCAGGFDHDLGMGTSAGYAYRPQSGSWTPIASMPADLWGGGYASANGELLISGGITRFSSELTNEGFGYDPASNTWQSLPNAPADLYRGGSACGLYRIGGEDSAGAVADYAQQLPGYTECDGGTGVPWLTATAAQRTLGPGQSATVTVAVRPGPAQGITQPGTYAATLRLDSGAPYPAPALPVTLTATPPAGWGKLAGTVDGQRCDGHRAPLDGATVQVNSKAGDWTLTADRAGRYSLWLDQSDSPVTLIGTDAPWLAQTARARIRGGQTTTVNLTLKQAGCG